MKSFLQYFTWLLPFSRYFKWDQDLKSWNFIGRLTYFLWNSFLHLFNPILSSDDLHWAIIISHYKWCRRKHLLWSYHAAPGVNNNLIGNDNYFVIWQHSELDLYKRPNAPLGHIILGPRQSVSTFIPNCCVSNNEATNGVWSNSRLIALRVHANHDTTTAVTRIIRKLQEHKFQWFDCSMLMAKSKVYCLNCFQLKV